MSKIVTPRSTALRRRPSLPLLAAAVAALVAAVVPSRARALDSDGLCVATGIIFCYKIEVGNGPFGPELRAYYPLWSPIGGQEWGW